MTSVSDLEEYIGKMLNTEENNFIEEEPDLQSSLHSSDDSEKIQIKFESAFKSANI